MKSSIANTNLFKVRTADKWLYLGLMLVGLFFGASYLLKSTSLAEVIGLESFTQLPGILAGAAKALLLVNLVVYIFSELTSDE